MKFDPLGSYWAEEGCTNATAPSNELKYSEELEIITHGTNNDHTYCNPQAGDVKPKDIKLEKNNSSSNCSFNSSKKKSNHTIPGKTGFPLFSLS